MDIVQPAIEVRAIGQRARSGKVTLHDVSMVVGHGELVAIIGGSGSGKTTLLDAMSGLRPPSSGTVVRSLPQPGHNRNIGYVANAETIHPVLPLGRALRYTAALRGAEVHDRAIENSAIENSAIENGAIVRDGAIEDGAIKDGAIEEALRAVRLAGSAATPVEGLDAGGRKRAAVAAELLAWPAQLFLEEPTIGLDPAQGTEVMRLLRRLCDAGTTVVLTTQNPLDAARCDKVAVLATGGHLAFFGTSEAACGYFGADSLDEIYERLAGLGDPATAWSRRFSPLSLTNAGFAPPPTVPPPPGPARLVPDSAGPHSAGRASADIFAGDARGGVYKTGPIDIRPIMADPARSAPLTPGRSAPPAGRAVARLLRPIRQAAVLARRNADVLARSRLALAALAGPPVAVLLAFLVLFTLGAFDPARPGAAFWVVFGGFFVGLAYGLPQIRPEAGVLRAERSAGLSAAAYVLAKAAVLIPVLAVADAVILLVPGVAGRLHGGGYGPAFVTLLLSSAVALALGLLLSAAIPVSSRTMITIAPACFPPILLAATLLALLDRPIWGDWLVMALLVVALQAATALLVAGRAPVLRSLMRP